MKKFLRTAALAVALLCGVLVARTVTFRSRQVSAYPAAKLVLDEDALLERFAHALTIRTVSSQEGEPATAAFHELHAFLRTSFPLVHQTLTVETIGGLSLLLTWAGNDTGLDPIVLMGHMDVVPVAPGTDDDWDHPPFAGVIDGGYVWGRGALDDKLAVLAILESVEALLRQGFRPNRTIYLAFGHDEEQGGSDGARAIAKSLEERGVTRLALVLDEGGVITTGEIPGVDAAVAVVGIAEKGSVTLTLRVEGPGGHASTPPEQTNIGILAKAIARLEDNPFPSRMGASVRGMFEAVGPEMSFGMRVVFANLWLFEPVVLRVMEKRSTTRALLHTTTAVTMIDGGFKSNVLASSAAATVNLRIVPGETPASVAERVRRVIADDRVKVVDGDGGRAPSPVSDASGTAFETLSRTIREVCGSAVIVAPYLVMPGTDARHFTQLSNNVYRFLPTHFTRADMRRIHGVNERVKVSSYFDTVRFFERLIQNFDQLP